MDPWLLIVLKKCCKILYKHGDTCIIRIRLCIYELQGLQFWWRTWPHTRIINTFKENRRTAFLTYSPIQVIDLFLRFLETQEFAFPFSPAPDPDSFPYLIKRSDRRAFLSKSLINNYSIQLIDSNKGKQKNKFMIMQLYLKKK